jgi:hypothetical protein
MIASGPLLRAVHLIGSSYAIEGASVKINLKPSQFIKLQLVSEKRWGIAYRPLAAITY